MEIDWEDYFLLIVSALNVAATVLFLAPLHFPYKKGLIKRLSNQQGILTKRISLVSNCVVFALALLIVGNGGPPPDAEGLEETDRAGLSEALMTQRRYLLAIGNLLLVLVHKRLLSLLESNGDLILEIEEACIERDILQFSPPSLPIVTAKVALFTRLFDPQVIGLEHLPEKGPCLIVGNHAVLGLDMPALLHAIYSQKGIYIRGLADHIHFGLPGWAQYLSFFGAVDGYVRSTSKVAVIFFPFLTFFFFNFQSLRTPRNCSALLREGNHVLVYPGMLLFPNQQSTDQQSDQQSSSLLSLIFFPFSFIILGGAHEVMSTEYQLQWKDRLGFVRQAAKHGAPIVPVATVGTNDMLDMVTKLPIGWLTGHRDLELPILKPNMTIQRVYYAFGRPIHPQDFFAEGKIDLADEKGLNEFKAQVKMELEGLIEQLRAHQAKDPQRFLSSRISTSSSDSNSPQPNFNKDGF